MDCENSPLIHKHHIIPRYMGGTDDSTNLVEVTVTQHAMFHFCNFQLWNNIEDYVAWRGLSGQISEQEFLAEKFKIFGKIGSDIVRERLKNDPDFRAQTIAKRLESWEKNREEHVQKLKEIQPKAVEAARTPEARERQKEKLKEINHQQGETNSQYGKVWIHNLEKKENTRIIKGEPIPDGWCLGRIMNFDAHIERLNIKKKRKEEKENELKEKIEYYSQLYDLYLTEGFQAIKSKYNYDKTQENLIMLFKKYVPNYVPFDCLRTRNT